MCVARSRAVAQGETLVYGMETRDNSLTGKSAEITRPPVRDRCMGNRFIVA